MKKIVLFNLACVQSKKWAQYHGGAENDFTVFMGVLNEIGNHSDWEIYGHFIEGESFIRDMEPILSTYKNLQLISDKKLDHIKENIIFHAIYSSDINGLEWMLNKRLQAQYSVIVIHGVRRYELQVDFFDLFLSHRLNRLQDKATVLEGLFMYRFARKYVARRHQSLFAKMPSTVNLVATSQDTYNKLLVMCPKLSRDQLKMLYTSPKTLMPTVTDTLHDEQILKKYNLKSKQYFLLISLGRIEKNVYFGLKNLKRLCTEHHLPFKIFACGETKKNLVINSFKKNSNVEIAGYIPGEDLRVLYKHAFLFVYPTRTEGFGMPVLESMEHGTPVCCTALSPLIEVGGMAAEYFSLKNDIEFRSKIIKFCSDPDFYEKKRQLSLARYQEMRDLQILDLKRKTQLILHGVA